VHSLRLAPNPSWGPPSPNRTICCPALVALAARVTNSIVSSGRLSPAAVFAPVGSDVPVLLRELPLSSVYSRLHVLLFSSILYISHQPDSHFDSIHDFWLSSPIRLLRLCRWRRSEVAPCAEVAR